MATVRDRNREEIEKVKAMLHDQLHDQLHDELSDISTLIRKKETSIRHLEEAIARRDAIDKELAETRVERGKQIYKAISSVVDNSSGTSKVKAPIQDKCTKMLKATSECVFTAFDKWSKIMHTAIEKTYLERSLLATLMKEFGEQLDEDDDDEGMTRLALWLSENWKNEKSDMEKETEQRLREVLKTVILQ
ncbi:hypothetical protein SLS58_003446 [Diplodia intermedia]|uniref:Uncharacterized protein n=1 Tax=Diplodia intermedia TaxID=856260 RepID=A0ABR3TW98_9PEZI